MKKRIPKSPKGREKLFKEVLSLSKKSKSEILSTLEKGLMEEYTPKGFMSIMQIETTLEATLGEIPRRTPSAGLYFYPTPLHRRIRSFRRLHLKRAEAFWRALKVELYQLFCDPARKKPKVNIDKLTHHFPYFGAVLAPMIRDHYGVGPAIVVPSAAILVKEGIANFCSNPPKYKPKKSVSDILAEEKATMEDIRKELREIIRQVKRVKRQIKSCRKKRLRNSS